MLNAILKGTSGRAPDHLFRRGIGYGVAAIAVLLLAPLAAWTAAGPRVDYSSGRVTIVAEEATLSSVAEQLSKSAGISVYLDRSEEARKVSVDVQAASFEKAMRNLARPLSFAIVSDPDGTVREIRIFRNAGLKESEYRVFAATRPDGVRPLPLPGIAASLPPSARPISSAAGAAASLRPSQPSTIVSPVSEPTGALAGPSRLLTGERALQASIWAAKQMTEAEQVRQNRQVIDDQAQSRNQPTSPGAQKEPTPLPQTSPGILAGQQSQQFSSLAYQQHTVQQTGFNSSVYYQQLIMRQNLRRGQ